MKSYLILPLLLIAVSCATPIKQELTIEEEVKEHEVKSFSEVNLHAQHLLEKHPELSTEAKSKLSSLINKTIERINLLKDEESKLVEQLFSESIDHSELKVVPKDIKKSLKAVYNAKFENVSTLIDEINDMYLKKELDRRFTRDAQIFMRDFR
jgi:hypothetical protein